MRSEDLKSLMRRKNLTNLVMRENITTSMRRENPNNNKVVIYTNLERSELWTVHKQDNTPLSNDTPQQYWRNHQTSTWKKKLRTVGWNNGNEEYGTAIYYDERAIDEPEGGTSGQPRSLMDWPSIWRKGWTWVDKFSSYYWSTKSWNGCNVERR